MFEQIQRRWLFPGLVASLVLTIDQVSKAWVLDTLGPEPLVRRIALIGDWLSLVYVQNTGVAFGMFQNGSQIFTVTSLLICAGAIYAYAYHLPNQSRWIQLSLGLIIGGAIGNLIDRVRFGYVVDFIQVHYGGWYFPSFNVADSAITVGAVLLVLDELRRVRRAG